MNINDKINEKNIATYKRYGQKFPGSYMYNCTLCKEACCIDNSFSYMGVSMICNRCAKTKFVNIETVMDFIEGNYYGSTKSKD